MITDYLLCALLHRKMILPIYFFHQFVSEFFWPSAELFWDEL